MLAIVGRVVRGRGGQRDRAGRYFKATGKRVFLMAPIHHHFEKKGWAEPQVVIRFWIHLADSLRLIGLATFEAEMSARPDRPTALVTGGNRGIGRAIAEGLVRAAVIAW